MRYGSRSESEVMLPDATVVGSVPDSRSEDRMKLPEPQVVTDLRDHFSNQRKALELKASRDSPISDNKGVLSSESKDDEARRLSRSPGVDRAIQEFKKITVPQIKSVSEPFMSKGLSPGSRWYGTNTQEIKLDDISKGKLTATVYQESHGPGKVIYINRDKTEVVRVRVDTVDTVDTPEPTLFVAGTGQTKKNKKRKYKKSNKRKKSKKKSKKYKKSNKRKKSKKKSKKLKKSKTLKNKYTRKR